MARSPLRAGVGARHRHGRLCLAFVGMLASVAVPTQGAGTRAQAPRARLALTECITDHALSGRCGFARVPLDWSHPGGRTIRLWVNVLPATGTRSADPLFYIEGGPGGASTEEDAWAAGTFAQLNRHHDIVLLDQRGTGRSSRLTCNGLERATQSGTAIDPAAVTRCIHRYGGRSRYFTTEQSVRDLDYLRSALGYGKVDVYGVSYGVSLGLAYLQRYGAHVRSAVFDSGSLLDVRLWQQAPVHAQQAFDQLVKRCASTPACSTRYHPAADLAKVVALLRAHPRTFVLGAGQKFTLTLAGFMSFVDDNYLTMATRRVLLPADLDLAVREGLGALVDRYKDRARASLSPTQLMSVTVRCGDEWAALDPRKLARGDTTLFTPMTVASARSQTALCAGWPHGPGAYGKVYGREPVLFLNGTVDPTDPPANVVGAGRTLHNAVTVAVPGAAHWVLNSDWTWGGAVPSCLLDGVTAFVESGRPADRARWAACTSTLSAQVPSFPPAA